MDDTMFALNQNDITQQNLEDTFLLNEFGNFVMLVKMRVNRWFFWTFTTIVVLTIGFILASKIRKSRKSVLKYMNKNDFKITTVEQYVKFRNASEKINKKRNSLQFFAKMHLISLPFPVRFIFKPLVKHASTQLTFEKWIERNLEFYNRQQFCLESNFLTFKSEKELRVKKVSSYDYWM